jgi:hypothetical protein
MMVEVKSVEILGSNLKSICLIAFVVGAVTGGNLWLHRDDLPLGYARFSGYGFSFDYPELLEIHSWGYPDSSSGPSDFGGTVQVKRYWEGVWENFWVLWYTEIGTPDLGVELETFYRNMDSWGCLTGNQGELLASEKDGHEMLLQTYTFWEDSFRPGGAEFITVSGVWCEPWPPLHANRVYVVTYIAFIESATRQQVLEEFQRYLDSFVGNVAES